MEQDLRAQQTDQPDRRACVQCPSCNHSYRIAARLLGRRLVCRHCHHEWRAYEVDGQSASGSGLSSVEHASDSGREVLPDDMPPVAGTRSVAIDTRWAGKQLGRYKVTSILGQGGMGVVWRGHDDTLRRDVALKILSRRRKAMNGSSGCLNTELFMQEARAVAKLQHPSVVSIFEVAEDAGQVFLALELMEGGTLKEHVDTKGPLSPNELFKLMVGPAKALALAHKRGIIHRDVKPGNLMFDDHGHLKLMDFGLADVATEAASARIRGKAVGSLGWVAPETAKGHGTTTASDIYCMGLVLLYALSGKPWLHADSRSKLIALHQNPPEPDFKGIAGLTPKAEAMIRRCLAVDPAERYESADDLSDALRECADENPVAVKKERTSRISIAIAGCALGALAGVAGVLWYFVNLDSKITELSQPTFNNTAKVSVENRTSTTPGTTPAQPDAPRPPKANSPSAAPVKSTTPPLSEEIAPAKPDKATPTKAGSPQSSSGGTDSGRFASLAEAKVPWPQVSYLLDREVSKIKFVGSRNSTVVHSADSDCGLKIYASNLVIFDSLQQALDQGRHPCPHCNAQPASSANIVRNDDGD